MINEITNKLIETKEYIKLGLNNAFNRYIIRDIIISSICNNDIKNYRGEKIMEYTDEHLMNIIWYELSYNPNITMEIIEKYPEKPWNWGGISMNPNLTMEFVEKHPEKNWSWFEISRNPNLTMEFVDEHPEKPWNWFALSCNPNLTIDFLEKHKDKDWNWEILLLNVNIPFDYIEKHPEKNWKLFHIYSQNKTINRVIIERLEKMKDEM